LDHNPFAPSRHHEAPKDTERESFLENHMNRVFAVLVSFTQQERRRGERTARCQAASRCQAWLFVFDRPDRCAIWV
jgi:hypothetical protein